MCLTRGWDGRKKGWSCREGAAKSTRCEYERRDNRESRSYAPGAGDPGSDAPVYREYQFTCPCGEAYWSRERYYSADGKFPPLKPTCGNCPTPADLFRRKVRRFVRGVGILLLILAGLALVGGVLALWFLTFDTPAFLPIGFGLLIAIIVGCIYLARYMERK
jgi:hypothetical protein